MPLVGRDLRLDLVEPVRRTVVCIDGELELIVDLSDLVENGLRGSRCAAISGVETGSANAGMTDSAAATSATSQTPTRLRPNTRRTRSRTGRSWWAKLSSPAGRK